MLKQLLYRKLSKQASKHKQMYKYEILILRSIGVRSFLSSFDDRCVPHYKYTLSRFTRKKNYNMTADPDEWLFQSPGEKNCIYYTLFYICFNFQTLGYQIRCFLLLSRLSYTIGIISEGIYSELGVIRVKNDYQWFSRLLKLLQITFSN